MFKNLNLFRALIAIVILFIPLYPKFPLASVTGTYVAIRLDDVVITAVVGIWGIYQLLHRFPFFKHIPSKLLLLYFLAIVASTITSVFVYQSDPLNILLLNLFRRFEYMSLFFVALDAFRTKKDFSFAYIFLLIATLLVTLYGFGQKYYRFPVVSTMNSEFSKGQLLEMDVWTRISSTFAGHYDLAAYMSVVLIIILAIGIITPKIWLKVASLVVWIPSFIILTNTASRISTVAFWGGAVLTLILIRKYFWIIPVTIFFIGSIASSGDLNQRLLATIPALQKQFLVLNPHPTTNPIPTVVAIPSSGPIPTTPVIVTHLTPIPTVVHHGPIEEQIPLDADAGVARSGEIRFKVEWPRAITAYRKNPATGTGLGSITLATDNDFLRLLGESGILGFIAFMAIFIYFILKTIPLIRVKKLNLPQTLSLIFFGCLLTTLANAVFIDVFEASKTAYLFWIMMAFYSRTLENST